MRLRELKLDWTISVWPGFGMHVLTNVFATPFWSIDHFLHAITALGRFHLCRFAHPTTCSRCRPTQFFHNRKTSPSTTMLRSQSDNSSDIRRPNPPAIGRCDVRAEDRLVDWWTKIG